MGRIQRIFLTHLHGDHLFGLPGLMCTLSAARAAAASTASTASTSSSPQPTPAGVVDLNTAPGSQGGGESSLLELVGPPGLREYIRTSLRLSYSFLSYPYTVHELHTPESAAASGGGVGSLGADIPFGSEILGKNLVPADPKKSPLSWVIPSELPGPLVVAGSIQHSVPTVGYVLQEPNTAGKLNVDAIRPLLEKNKEGLQKQGVKNPMALLAKVKGGEKVSLPDGTELDPANFVGPERPGKKVAILGDTHDPWSMRDLLLDCDLLVHEATNARLAADSDKTEDEVEETAKDHGHSTPQMAGKFGREVGARCLVLTHFSQRYKGDEEPESVATMEEIRLLAEREFNRDRVARGEKGLEVIIARDLATIPVK